VLLPLTVQAADASVRPEARYEHSAITHNSSSEVVIFGGFVDEGCFNDVISFSMRTRHWTRHECVGASPSPRAHHAACRVAESIYIFGGKDSLNDLWKYALDMRRERR